MAKSGKSGSSAKNARRKFDLAKSGLLTLAKQFPRDSGTYYKNTLNNDVINYQYVGVILGNLRRSWKVVPAVLGRIFVRNDVNVAPYAKYVLYRTIRKYGKSYLQITTDKAAPTIIRVANIQVAYMLAATNRRRKFMYQNQFLA